MVGQVKDDIKEKGLSADEVYDCATWRSYVVVHRSQMKVGIRSRRRINEEQLKCGSRNLRLYPERIC